MRYSIVFVFFLILHGCGSSSSGETAAQTIQQGELLFEIDGTTLKKMLAAQGYPVDEYEVYGYQAYKIPYVTTDERGDEVNVSGLLVLPTGVNSQIEEEGLAMVSYGHGTITSNWNAPTLLSQDHVPIDSAVIFTSLGGFATLEADYIGYGDSLGTYHPYVMQKSLANCSVDFITAVRSFAQVNGIKLSGKLFVTGYSEGGYTAMSTLKRLEEQNIAVTAAAPIAGPYNLNTMADILMGIESFEGLSDYARVYALLTSNAYSKSYDQNLDDFIDTDAINYTEYDSNGTPILINVEVDDLLDGTANIDDVLSALPANMTGENGLIRSSFIEAYRNDPEHWFRMALGDNNVDDWNPKTPMRLVHCQGDDQVPYTIAQQTYANLAGNGANDILLISPDSEAGQTWSHIECYYPSLQFVAQWFVQERDK